MTRAHVPRGAEQKGLHNATEIVVCLLLALPIVCSTKAKAFFLDDFSSQRAAEGGREQQLREEVEAAVASILGQT